MQNGITLIALVISIIVMLILAGVSINAIVGDNGIIGKSQQATIMQSVAALQEYLQMEYSNYAFEDNPYETAYGLLKAKNPGWFYQNAQGYILDSEGHVLYLIRKSGLPEDIKNQIRGGDASKVSQYYKQQDVYGVTSDLQVYYCSNGISSIIGLSIDDLQKDNPLEVAYDEDSLLAKVINGEGEDGRATEALSAQALKSIKTLTIDTEEKLELLKTFGDLINLQTVYFKDITIPNVNGIQNGANLTEVRFTNCTVQDYSAMCGLTKLNKLYLIKPAGKNDDVNTLCSLDKGIATAELSNLEYFGIVGDETYIQSIDQTYMKQTLGKYDVTDVSGLSNLSQVTKQAIKYMYLQNLQMTSIASLADFVNVTILRCEENALVTFDGIQNMSKLTYLIASDCYSNNDKIYTLGSNEGDEKNSTTDALSYIYKDENGKNTSLYYLDIRNAQDLKWTSYLSTCTEIRYLYMANSNSVKDVSTIANIIGNCGTNYSMGSSVSAEIISNNSALLDLKETTITESQFKILKNNANLTHLSLWNTEITNDVGGDITDDDYTNLINEVLSTCTSMKHLSLFGQTKLKNIDFVANMNSLKELDLYDCSQVNDISILENKTNSSETTGFELEFLNINNVNIDLTKIQKTISNLGTPELKLGYTATYWYGNYSGDGLMIGDIGLASKLSQCTEITNLVIYRGWSNTTYLTNINGKIDLSTCAKLENVKLYSCKIEFKMPSSLLSFITGYTGTAKCDLSNCINLENINFSDQLSYDTISSMLMSLPNNINKLKYVTIRTKNYTFSDFNYLAKLTSCTSLENFTFQEVNDFKGLIIESFDGLENLTYAKSIKIDLAYNNPSVLVLPELSNLVNLSEFYIKGGNVSDVSNVSTYTRLTDLSILYEPIRNVNALSNLSSLTNVTLNNNQITDISGLSGLTNLATLDLSNNNINNIKPLENLKKLETINLEKNALFDTSADSSGNSYYTLTVFSDLNQKQDGSLKNLYLSGNNIEDYSMLRDSNLKWEETDWIEEEENE